MADYYKRVKVEDPFEEMVSLVSEIVNEEPEMHSVLTNTFTSTGCRTYVERNIKMGKIEEMVGKINDILKEDGDGEDDVPRGAYYFNLAIEYFYGDRGDRNYKKALEWLIRSAEQGHAKAKFYVGLLHYYGKGTAENYEEALKWFRTASALGISEATHFVVCMCDNGYGSLKNKTEEMRWFIYDQPRAEEQFNVGLHYYYGITVSPSIKEAHKWFRKAAERGHAQAQFYLGKNFYRGTEPIPEDNAKAKKWFEKAAEQGNFEACFYMGQIYKCGYSVDKDIDKAIKWFRKAAELGYSAADLPLYNLIKEKEKKDA